MILVQLPCKCVKCHISGQIHLHWVDAFELNLNHSVQWVWENVMPSKVQWPVFQRKIYPPKITTRNWLTFFNWPKSCVSFHTIFQSPGKNKFLYTTLQDPWHFFKCWRHKRRGFTSLQVIFGPSIGYYDYQNWKVWPFLLNSYLADAHFLCYYCNKEWPADWECTPTYITIDF